MNKNIPLFINGGNDLNFSRVIKFFPVRNGWTVTAFIAPPVYYFFYYILANLVPSNSEGNIWGGTIVLGTVISAVLIGVITCYCSSQELWNEKYSD
jgi:hypothetical protein